MGLSKSGSGAFTYASRGLSVFLIGLSKLGSGLLGVPRGEVDRGFIGSSDGGGGDLASAGMTFFSFVGEGDSLEGDAEKV